MTLDDYRLGFEKVSVIGRWLGDVGAHQDGCWFRDGDIGSARRNARDDYMVLGDHLCPRSPWKASQESFLPAPYHDPTTSTYKYGWHVILARMVC